MSAMIERTPSLSAEMALAVRPVVESSEALLAQLERKDWYLPALQQMSTEARRQEWLSVRVLLKGLLGEEKEIGYLPSGQPFLIDGSGRLSLSHTKGFVAVAFHPCLPVGVDIEYRSPRVRKIRSRFLSQAEEDGLCREQEDLHLLLHWSGKETLFKALGEENVDFRECLHIHPFRPELNKMSSFSASESRTAFRRGFTVEYLANDDYVLTATLVR